MAVSNVNKTRVGTSKKKSIARPRRRPGTAAEIKKRVVRGKPSVIEQREELEAVKGYGKEKSKTDIISATEFFTFLEDRHVDYKQVRDVIPIKEWVRSTYYLGDEANTIYPYWEDVLVEFIESEKNELILTGSIRSGKSNTALLLAIRKFYELSCYDPIPRLFGLSATSLVLFMYLSLSLNQANLLGMGRIRRMLDKIPYFAHHFPRDPKSETLIKFRNPGLCMLGGSELGHFKGGDLYYLIFDEANFARGALDLKFQNAVDIYREATIRRKSTFMIDGQEQGVGVIISSSDTQSSFVERHIEDAKHDPNVMIVHAVQYEVQPERYKGMIKFPVFIGNDDLDPFLPKTNNMAWKNFCNIYGVETRRYKFHKDDIPEDMISQFRWVPETFFQSFKLDIYGALREVCGVAIGQSGRFFLNRVKFYDCFPRGTEDQHPFRRQEIIVSYQDQKRIEEDYTGGNNPPHYEYFGGIDQSLTDDRTGIALCHYNPHDFDLKITFDFMLRINPPQKPSKISPEKIVNFFIWLCKEKGVRNLKVRMDTYATDQAIQTLAMAGVEGEQHSLDRDWDDYRSFSGAILDDKIEGYYHEGFREELFGLIQDNERKKVDHPADGSKDVADAACQAYSGAMDSWLQLKGGIRFFNNFHPRNLTIYRVEPNENGKIYVGIYFGPLAFYAVWLHVRNKGTAKQQVLVVGEYINYSSTAETRVNAIKSKTMMFSSGEVVTAGDPEARIKSDVSATSPFKEYRKLGLSLRCRKRLDRYNFEIVKKLLRYAEGDDIKLLINEPECPLLISALRKAKYKTRGGVRTGVFDKTGSEFPVIAFRVALEEALSKAIATGY